MPAATKPESRSPSPAPPPPIADAPGPRAQGLINIYNQAVDATLKKCSPANFASCFPTAAEHAPEVLESLRSPDPEGADAQGGGVSASMGGWGLGGGAEERKSEDDDEDDTMDWDQAQVRVLNGHVDGCGRELIVVL